MEELESQVPPLSEDEVESNDDEDRFVSDDSENEGGEYDSGDEGGEDDGEEELEVDDRFFVESFAVPEFGSKTTRILNVLLKSDSIDTHFWEDVQFSNLNQTLTLMHS